MSRKLAAITSIVESHRFTWYLFNFYATCDFEVLYFSVSFTINFLRRFFSSLKQKSLSTNVIGELMFNVVPYTNNAYICCLLVFCQPPDSVMYISILVDS